MIVAPITFCWTDSGPYCWEPVVQRDAKSPAYWNYAWDLMQQAGCNAAVVLMGSSVRSQWVESLAVQGKLMYQRGLPYIPYFCQASFTEYGWPGDRQKVPDDPAVIAVHLLRLIDWVRPAEILREGDRPILGLLGNFSGVHDGRWHRRTLRRVGKLLEYDLGGEPLWFVDRHSAKVLKHDEQLNLFTHNGYLIESGRTAAVRPGFWNYGSPNGRFIPRARHRPWRRALRTALANDRLAYLFIESEGEYKEGSSILPCDPVPIVPPGDTKTDEWGDRSDRPLRILSRFLGNKNKGDAYAR